MRRRRTTSRKPAKTRYVRATKPKRGKAPPVARRSSSSAADLEKRVAVLARELAEAREQQIASSEALRLISSSPSDLQSVFQSILANTVRVCEAKFGALFRFESDALRLVASFDLPQALMEFLIRAPRRPNPNAPIMRAVRTKQPVHVADFRTEPAYIEQDEMVIAGVERGGIRTLLVVPYSRRAS